MNLALILDTAGALIVLLGAVMTLITALGQVRLDTLYSRMHVATKPQSLSLMLLCFGLALLLRDSRATWTLFLVVLMQWLTAPMSAHLLGRSGYRSAVVDEGDLLVNEYLEDLREGSGRDRH